MSNPTDQQRLEAEWARLSDKYKCGKDYRIICDCNYKTANPLPWEKGKEKTSQIRGEVLKRDKIVVLTDKNYKDKCECLRHEFFEVLFDELIAPHIGFGNNLEAIINHMVETYNKLAVAFMQESYLNKEVFIAKFVAIEDHNDNQPKQKGQVKMR